MDKTKEEQKALDKALFFIIKRPHSENELRKKLEKKFSVEILISVFKRLKKYGYLNDKEFAKVWVRERKKLKPRGKRALFLELIKKGVKKEIIENELSKINENEEIKEAENIVTRKYKNFLEIQNMTYKDKLELKKKIYNFLGGRGYDYNVVKEAIRRLMG